MGIVGYCVIFCFKNNRPNCWCCEESALVKFDGLCGSSKVNTEHVKYKHHLAELLKK